RLDLDRPVPRSVDGECLRAAVQAPSGSNKQTSHFVVVGDPALRTALADLYRRAFAEYRKVAPGSPAIGAPAGSAARRFFDSAEYLAENLERAPYLVLSVVRGRCEELHSAHDQSRFWGEIHPATWNFMLAARARGLGTAWT